MEKTLNPKPNWPSILVEKLVEVLVILFCKIFIPSYTFDAPPLCRNWLSKLVGKFSWGPSYFCFVKFFIPSYKFDALLCWNWPSKFVEKLVEVPVSYFCFVKFSFPVTHLMPPLCWNWPSKLVGKFSWGSSYFVL